MDWYEKFNKTCKKNNVEALRSPDGAMLIICPKKPGKQVQESIEGDLPENMPCRYIEGPKPSTKYSLRKSCRKFIMMGTADASPDDRKLTILLSGQTIEEPDWTILDDLLLGDGYFDQWSVQVNEQEVYVKTRQELESLQAIAKDMSRNRDRVLTADDMTNVRIFLGTIESVDDFIARA